MVFFPCRWLFRKGKKKGGGVFLGKKKYNKLKLLYSKRNSKSLKLYHVYLHPQQKTKKKKGSHGVVKRILPIIFVQRPFRARHLNSTLWQRSLNEQRILSSDACIVSVQEIKRGCYSFCTAFTELSHLSLLKWSRKGECVGGGCFLLVFYILYFR